jgi:hypothetical protein
MSLKRIPTRRARDSVSAETISRRAEDGGRRRSPATAISAHYKAARAASLLQSTEPQRQIPRENIRESRSLVAHLLTMG